MIRINRYCLSNGLRLIHHQDKETQMVALNLLYDVGSKDENPDCTGFAHLFEHLMFGGSVNIPDFDTPLQKAGGENNAWTSNDITNYYSVVPRQNVETAFWLESDRMLGLDFSEKSLSVQKQVVIEEFKQRNLNQPYGDIPLLIRPLAYKVHPYRWPTIGKRVEHIEQVKLEDVKSFFYKHYAPNNAILAVTGNISFEEAVELTEKWFGTIERRDIEPRNLPAEPVQKSARFQEVSRSVPLDSITKVYHMCRRMDKAYHCFDLLSDILSNGRSSRLFQRLVMDRKLFADIDASITGDIDAGLFMIKGKVNKGISLEEADRAIVEELRRLGENEVSAYELQKVVNKFESNDLFSNINYLNKATNLAYYELLDKAENIDSEIEKYKGITSRMLKEVAERAFVEENSSTLYYRADGDLS
ncbi:M16 family metallopeptidase [Coprobacter fastidiosus]|uniref:Putative Zn-dependent peptidase n=1 Tax=Coprobacter fastidiosus NSB1 = JCM 33896 TaxID=1349822 RepID=A0A495WH31_9BACT|nr:pitrilysin family protein [Coprobacter fastidiosus]RKT61031.1 putative Zn-dependent peptidase [Coprobacter fastidiosus NSB1 = JCM 33896]